MRKETRKFIAISWEEPSNNQFNTADLDKLQENLKLINAEMKWEECPFEYDSKDGTTKIKRAGFYIYFNDPAGYKTTVDDRR